MGLCVHETRQSLDFYHLNEIGHHHTPTEKDECVSTLKKGQLKKICPEGLLGLRDM